jgi:hypothetical protein
MNLYLDNNLKNIKSNLFLLFASLLTYVFWYTFNIGGLFTYSFFHISLAHIGYFILLLIPSFCITNNSFFQKLWIFFSGLTILDLPPLMYIANNKDIDPSIFTSSITFIIIIFLALISMIYGLSDLKQNIYTQIKSKNIILIFSSSLFFITLYHGSNYYLKIYKNIPNEERSIFINGLEFHHINYGLTLLIFIPMLFKYASKLSSLKAILIYLFIGFIYGTIFDECYYYMLNDMTDDAYLYSSVIGIQLLFMMIVFSLWYYINKREKA